MRFTLLSLALLALPSVASASPYETPEAYCHDVAEAAYQLAVARGDGLPDATYERVQTDCDWQAYRAHLIASRSVSLNELVAFDQDFHAYEGIATASERELARQEAAAFLAACPDAEPGDESCN